MVNARSPSPSMNDRRAQDAQLLQVGTARRRAAHGKGLGYAPAYLWGVRILPHGFRTVLCGVAYLASNP